MIPGLFAFDAPASPEPIPVSLGPLAWFRAPFLAKQLQQRGWFRGSSHADPDRDWLGCNH